MVPEGILSIPDILLLDDVQVERAYLLHAEKGVSMDPLADQGHFVILITLASFLEHEVAHPLFA